MAYDITTFFLCILLVGYVVIKESLAFLGYRRESIKTETKKQWNTLYEAQNEDIKKVHVQLQLLNDRFDKIDIKAIADRIEWIWASHYKALDNAIEALAKNVEKQTEVLSKEVKVKRTKKSAT